MDLWARLRDDLANDPFTTLALLAALIALATTPIAFAVLGRLDWLKARYSGILSQVREQGTLDEDALKAALADFANEFGTADTDEEA